MKRFFKFIINNYKPLLTSFLLALLLWVAVATDKDYTTKLVVPFKISRVAPGYVLSEIPESKVVLEVSGKGRALFGLNFYNSSIDLELPEFKKSTVLHLNDYQKRFNIPRNMGIDIIEILEPKTISIKIDKFVQEKKPIRVHSDIKPMPGYVLSMVELNTDSVFVSGPAKIVSNLKIMHTADIIKTEMKYPFHEESKLKNPNPGVVLIEPNNILIKFDIEQLVERTLYNIPIQLVGIPAYYKATAIPPNVSIRVKGSESHVTKLSATDLTAIFNYRNVYERGKTLYEVQIDAPEEIDLLTISPNTFRLQLRRRGDTE